MNQFNPAEDTPPVTDSDRPFRFFDNIEKYLPSLVAGTEIIRQVWPGEDHIDT